jgi:hypothetical protein
MSDRPTFSGDRRIAWQNVMTVISAAILIGAEVFGAAFAGGWAVANLFDLGPYGVHIMQGIFFLCATPNRSSRSRPKASATLRRHAPSSSLKTFAATRVARERFEKILAMRLHIAYVRDCPISHVPVAVCRSVGIRTRGRTAARSEIAEFTELRLRSSELRNHLTGSRRRNRRTPRSTGDAA